MDARPRTASAQLCADAPIHAPPWKTWAAAGLVALASIAAYANSFHGPMIFDDGPAITDNASIQGEWWESLLPPEGGQTVTGRPLMNLSLAVNYHWHQKHVTGYHIVNLAVHLGAALALFGLVRRTFRLPSLRAQFGGDALPLALATSLLWLLHPLQTASVSYIIQRAEAMMGMFYFVTFYCFVRGAESRPRLWLALSCVSCVLGVLCKEVTVTAPALVLLFDRIFVAESWGAIFRRRGWYYAGLAMAMALQIWMALDAGTRGNSAGFGAGVEWWDYAFSQFPAIAHYLGLCVWPAAQSLDYGKGLAEGVWQALPAQLLVMALVAATVWALARRPKLGFLGAWFFIVLAPSSSIVPVTTETMAEHRLYVPLAALAALAALGLRALPRRGVFPTAAALLALAFGALTFARNQDFRHATTIWQDAVAKNPVVARPHNNLGIAFAGARRYREAIPSYQRALRLSPHYPDCELNLGNAFAEIGELSRALVHYQKAAREMPAMPQMHYSLGNAYRLMNRWPEAAAAYGDALRAAQAYMPARGNLMGVYNELGQYDKSIALGTIADSWHPGFVPAHTNLANAYLRTNQPEKALGQYVQLASKWDPASASTYWGIGNGLIMLNQPDEAIVWYRVALTYNPNDPVAHNNVGVLLQRAGRIPEAVVEYREALRLAPGFADAKNNLEAAQRQLASQPPGARAN